MIYYEIQTWSIECEKRTTTIGANGGVKLNILNPELNVNANYEYTADSKQKSNTCTVRVSPNGIALSGLS
jgi:hypothetical protein